MPVPFIFMLPLRGVSQGGLRYWRAGFGDTLDDDHFYDGLYNEGCCATLKDAYGNGLEDLPFAILTLISDVRMFQSCWTCTGLGQ